MRAIVHVTKECKTVDEAHLWYAKIRNILHEFPAVHLNGQITVKFLPSHPEGTPEEGPKP